MGKALIIPNVSFATDNLGQITFADGLLRSITIVGSDSISGASTYTVTYNPQDTEHTGVEWTVLSGNATIGRDTGVLTPSADGTVIIQAQSTYNRSIVATKTISVSIVVPLTSISIYGSDSIDGVSTYSVIYNPQNTTQTGVTWSVLSGNATIDSDTGVLTPTQSGTVVIKAESTYSSLIYDTKTISVSITIPVTDINIVGSSTIATATTYSITYTPNNTTQQGVVWFVDSGNATISQQGVLSPTADGTVVIRATSTYDQSITKTKTITVDSTIPVTGITIVGPGTIENEATYSISYSPANTTQTGVNWEVTSGYATINSAGVLTLTGVSSEITIRATSTHNQNVFNTKTITVDTTHHYERDYVTVESLDDDNTISLTNFQGLTNPTLQYSQDGGQTWTGVTSVKNQTLDVVTINQGDVILLKSNRNNVPWANSRSAYNAIRTSGRVNVSGNILSLMAGDNFQSYNESVLPAYTFVYLFHGAKVVDASNLVLPLITGTSCYDGMFKDCTTLTYAPTLPATTLNNDCYREMFYGCTSLTTAPSLPVTTLAARCYREMFKQSGLTSIPTNFLPATALTEECYYGMFEQCLSLTNVCDLPSTTLASGCYRAMFSRCHAIQTVPSNLLPATTLAANCYRYMFASCTGLTVAPILPAETLVEGCYNHMFNNDKVDGYNNMSLNTITCLATDISATDCTNSWLKQVGGSGTFIKNANMNNWPTASANGIPSGWTVEDYIEPSNNE